MSEFICGLGLLLMVIGLGGMWIGIALTMVRNGNDLTRREFEMKKRLAAQSGANSEGVDHE